MMKLGLVILFMGLLIAPCNMPQDPETFASWKTSWSGP